MASQPHNFAIKSIIYALILYLCLLSTGCLVVPASVSYSNSRTNVDTFSDNPFTVGRSTRAAVLLKLGEPDAAENDGETLYDQWSKKHLYFMWVIPVPNGDAGSKPMVGVEYALRFKFDKKGVLTEMDLAKDVDWVLFDKTPPS